MSPVLLLWAVGATVAAVVAYRGTPGRIRRRRLRHTAPCSIANFPHGGYERIVGRLELAPDHELIAPISGRRCAAYEVLVQGLDSRGDEHWDTIAYEMQAVPFIVKDETGRAHVDPARGKLLVTLDSHQRSGPLGRATPEAQEFLRRKGKTLSPWAPTIELRFREGVLEHDELVTVMGRGMVSVSDDAAELHTGGYRTPAGSRKLQIAAGPRRELLMSDDPTLVE